MGLSWWKKLTQCGSSDAMDKLTRHQILLYSGDFERLKNIYANHSPTSIVRELVRAHLHRVEAKLRETKENERQQA
jgi:hypothetical protein